MEQVEIISALAYLLQYIAEYGKAEELYEKALEIRERLLGEEHPSTVAIYNDLAVVYESQGKYRKMFAYYLKSFSILCSKLGVEHPNTQGVYENLKSVYSERDPEGDFEGARRKYECF